MRAENWPPLKPSRHPATPMASGNANGQWTFRDLDGNVLLPSSTSALEDWYIKVRDTKLADLDVGHLARACRQNLFIDDIIPFCLLQLEEDPLAGELYNGELVVALGNISSEYWQAHPDERYRFLNLAKLACQESGDDTLSITESQLLKKTV